MGDWGGQSKVDPCGGTCAACRGLQRASTIHAWRAPQRISTQSCSHALRGSSVSAEKRARKLAAARKSERRQKALGKLNYDFGLKIASAASFLSALKLFEVQYPAREMFRRLSWIKLTPCVVLSTTEPFYGPYHQARGSRLDELAMLECEPYASLVKFRTEYFREFEFGSDGMVDFVLAQAVLPPSAPTDVHGLIAFYERRALELRKAFNVR